jgi:hypothetical protein
MSIDHIEGLDWDAWNRWVAYRSAIKKPLKEVSLHAAALKLSKYGKDQAEVVDQSISNQWQGLFDLKKKKTGEKPVKTDVQVAKDNEAFIRQQDYAIKGWELREPDPLGKLRLCEALLARYTIEPDADTPERIDWLKQVVSMHIRACDPKDIWNEPHVLGMIRHLFGDAGYRRIRERATH